LLLLSAVANIFKATVSPAALDTIPGVILRYGACCMTKLLQYDTKRALHKLAANPDPEFDTDPASVAN
jgi:hypothetical protein